MSGFSKMENPELKNKATSLCVSITSQPYFDPGLPTATLRTSYRTNVRSVLLYGTLLVKDVNELEKLYVKLLQSHFKKLLFLARVPPPRLWYGFESGFEYLHSIWRLKEGLFCGKTNWVNGTKPWSKK